MRQKVSDYIADFLASHDLTQIFCVVGGGAMHLNDSLGHHPRLSVLYNHHEQASAMAAESYARVAEKPGVVCVTSGPGGINALNGVAGAYLDSIPMLVFSGQMKREMTTRYTHQKVRSLGTQEFDIVASVQNMTKFAVMVEDARDIRYDLEKAYVLATSGRPGPCWLDVPLDIQGAVIETDELRGYETEGSAPKPDASVLEQVISQLRQAKRPIVYAGNGIRLAHAYDSFLRLVEQLEIPVVTCWDSIDLIPSDHPCYCGRGGTMGDRAGNFAVQNSDFLLAVGARLGILQAGYNVKTWARAATTCMVDIDAAELAKPTLHIDIPVQADAGEFLSALLERLPADLHAPNDWQRQCLKWRTSYPVVRKEQYEATGLANVYAFIDTLSRRLPEGTIAVAANGSASVVGSQTYFVKRGSRFILNCAMSSMGYDLPAAVGASVGTHHGSVICLAGDGSIMMNLQELQTIATNELPVKIIIINNQGYHQIRQTQNNLFHDGLVGVGPESHDLSFPEFRKIACAFDYPYVAIRSNAEFESGLEEFLSLPGRGILEVFVSITQKFEPKSATKRLPDGRLVSPPLEDLAPFLPREELAANMFIPLVQED